MAACLPDPATIGDKMHGKTCAGTWVTGTGKDGNHREVYLYHVVDNQETMAKDGAQGTRGQLPVKRDGQDLPGSGGEFAAQLGVSAARRRSVELTHEGG